jgi:hypothetical protein
LLVGEDETLLSTRAAVLHKTGAEIVPVDPLRIGEHGFPYFDLLVLCHSLQTQTALAIAVGARKRWPGIQILQLVRFEFEKTGRETHADAVVAAHDPNSLEESARDLLTPRSAEAEASGVHPRG